MDNFIDKQLAFMLLHLKALSNCNIEGNDIQAQINNFIGTIAYPNLGFTNSSIEIEKDLVRFRQTASLILNSIVKGVDANRKVASKTQEDLAKVQNFREKYPLYVNIKAPKEHLIFADKLKKAEYTQIEAATLLGISRQTLGKYVKESTHGFKFNPKNKKVTGEQLYNYYIKNMKTK